MISIRHLNAFYHHEQILHDIQLTIQQHKILAIIGPSGCGKSTLLYAINRLIEEREGKTTGEIFLNDKNIKVMDIETLRQNIGMVFQTPCPFPFSVYKNICLPLQYHKHYTKPALEQQVQQLLTTVDLINEVDIHKNALQLSGGQQQRLCIARALAAQVQFLLLDEPCSHLDVKNTQKIEQLLLKLKQHIGIVIVTHNLAQAKRIADTTAFMFEGRILEYGETAHVFESPSNDICKSYMRGLVG